MWFGMFSVTEAIAWYMEGIRQLQVLTLESDGKIGAFSNQKGMY